MLLVLFGQGRLKTFHSVLIGRSQEMTVVVTFSLYPLYCLLFEYELSLIPLTRADKQLPGTYKASHSNDKIGFAL